MPLFAGNIDHLVVEALAVHVDLDRPPGGGNARKGLAPEVIVAFRNASLDVDAESQASNLWHLPQQFGQGVTAIRREVLVGDAEDGLPRARHVIEVIALRPQRELELHAAACNFLADELQHLQVVLTFFLGETRNADAVAGHRHQIRIRKIEIDIGDPQIVTGIIVAHAQGQRKPVDAAIGQRIEISPPLVLVVEPDLVLFLAAKQARDGTDAGGRGLNDRQDAEDFAVRLGVTRPVRKLR